MISETLIEPFFECTTYNVLVLGDSKAGKTTFVNLLLSNNLTFGEKSVWRGTRMPMSKTLYNRFDKKDIIVQMLDTPGFGEATDVGSNRTDTELRNLITEFTKSNITSVNMILITINAATGLLSHQIKSILELFDFFGNKFNSTFALLITHFDNNNLESEKKWISYLEQNPQMKDIYSTILKDKIFFTGSYIDSVESETLNTFLFLQNDRKKRFLEKLIQMKSVSFKNDGSANVLPLDIYESAKLTSLNLRTLPEENENQKRNLVKLRMDFAYYLKTKEFSEMHDLKERVESIMSRTERFSKDTVKLAKPSEEQLKKYCNL